MDYLRQGKHTRGGGECRALRPGDSVLWTLGRLSVLDPDGKVSGTIPAYLEALGRISLLKERFRLQAPISTRARITPDAAQEKQG